MKYSWIFIVSIFYCFFSCKKAVENTSVKIAKNKTTEKHKIIIGDTLEISKDSIVFNPIKATSYYKGRTFTGYSLTYHSNNKLKQKTLFIDGKREGQSKQWYSNGMMSKLTNYKNNKIEGKTTSWYVDGSISAQNSYVENKKHGVQKRWHPNGQLAKQTNYKMDQEHGMQKAWLNNGKIYINYQAKNGRSFGLKRSTLCFSLEDEKLKKKK